MQKLRLKGCRLPQAISLHAVSSKELKRARRVASVKKNRIRSSCLRCRKIKVKCSDVRPCQRCVRDEDVAACIGILNVRNPVLFKRTELFSESLKPLLVQGYEENRNALLRQQTFADMQSITDQGGSSHNPFSSPLKSTFYAEPFLFGVAALSSPGVTMPNCMAAVPRGQSFSTTLPMIDTHAQMRQADFQLCPIPDQPHSARLLAPNSTGAWRSQSWPTQEPPSDCLKLGQARVLAPNPAYPRDIIPPTLTKERAIACNRRSARRPAALAHAAQRRSLTPSGGAC